MLFPGEFRVRPNIIHLPSESRSNFTVTVSQFLFEVKQLNKVLNMN